MTRCLCLLHLDRILPLTVKTSSFLSSVPLMYPPVSSHQRIRMWIDGLYFGRLEFSFICDSWFAAFFFFTTVHYSVRSHVCSVLGLVTVDYITVDHLIKLKHMILEKWKYALLMISSCIWMNTKTPLVHYLRKPLVNITNPLSRGSVHKSRSLVKSSDS